MTTEQHGLSRRTHLLIRAYGGTLAEQLTACRLLGVDVDGRHFTFTRNTPLLAVLRPSRPVLRECRP